MSSLFLARGRRSGKYHEDHEEYHEEHNDLESESNAEYLEETGGTSKKTGLHKFGIVAASLMGFSLFVICCRWFCGVLRHESLESRLEV